MASQALDEALYKICAANALDRRALALSQGFWNRTRMRIVQALGSSGRGGAERFFTRLAKAFHARNIPQAVLTRRNAWAAEQLEKAGIPVQTAWFGGKFDFVTRVKYGRALRALHATVAINWMPHATAACPQGPWVKVARMGKCYPLERVRGLRSPDRKFAPHRLLYRSARLAREPISFIPNFVPANDAARARRSAFNTPEDAPLILWLGRMVRDKGPDIAVRALAKLPQAYLWMAGAGSVSRARSSSLRRRWAFSGRIRFLGRRDDVHALFKAADILSSAPPAARASVMCWKPIPMVFRSYRPTPSIRPIWSPMAGPAFWLRKKIPQRLPGRQFADHGPDLGRAPGRSRTIAFSGHFSEEPVIRMYLDLCRRLKEDYAWRTNALLRPNHAAPDPAPA